MTPGPLIVVSGPSGCGKSTVLRRLLDRGRFPLRLSVSATTRPARENEQDGVHYHFWDRDRFLGAIAAGEFLEWAEVHGNLYGTLRQEVEPYRQQGLGVLLDIDVQGFVQVRTRTDVSLSVFMTAPSLEELERRLRGRRSEDEARVRLRLANALREMNFQGEYQHRLVNDDLDRAVAELENLLAPLFTREPHAG